MKDLKAKKDKTKLQIDYKNNQNGDYSIST